MKKIDKFNANLSYPLYDVTKSHHNYNNIFNNNFLFCFNLFLYSYF